MARDSGSIDRSTRTPARSKQQQQPPNVDHFRIAHLKKQARSFQSSLNYWTAATQAAHAAIDKQTGETRKQFEARYKSHKQHADEAQEQLNEIKDQLAKLDPTGAAAHRTTTLKANIKRRSNELADMRQYLKAAEARANTPEASLEQQRRMIQKRQTKLDELITELNQHTNSTATRQGYALRTAEAHQMLDVRSRIVPEEPETSGLPTSQKGTKTDSKT